MSSQVRLVGVRLLDEFRAALSRFTSETQDVLNVTALEATRTLVWLDERQKHWRTEVKHLQEIVKQAHTALAKCQSNSRDSHNSCDSEREKLRIGQAHLQAAEEEFRKASYWMKQVEEAAGNYTRQAKQFSTFLNSDLPKAKATLKQKADIAHSYLALHTLQSMVSNSRARGDHIETSIPSTAIPLNTFQDVEISQLPWQAEHVQTPEDFKKVSYETMIDGLQKLQEVVRIGVSKGASGEEFSKLDAQLGLDYEHGYHRIYDAFYGNDAIYINKIGDTYEVINGYHRLFVAHQLGIETLPMRLNEISITTNMPPEFREGTYGGPEREG